MKITRQQLIKIIQEAIISEMPMIKPGGDIDPTHYEKLTGLIGTGDEETITHADQLASMVGHDSEQLSQDLEDYDRATEFEKFGWDVANLSNTVLEPALA